MQRGIQKADEVVVLAQGVWDDYVSRDMQAEDLPVRRYSRKREGFRASV
jgi:hypothetical protein